LEDFVTSGMAADHKTTMLKGNRTSIENKLVEVEFACADAYYMWGSNNEIEFGRGKLLLHLHNVVQ